MSEKFRVSSLNQVKNIPSAKSNTLLAVAYLGRIIPQLYYNIYKGHSML